MIQGQTGTSILVNLETLRQRRAFQYNMVISRMEKFRYSTKSIHGWSLREWVKKKYKAMNTDL